MDTQIIKCGRCDCVLRVPRNMGRLRVTCPLCRYEFLHNSDLAAPYNGPAAPGPSAPGPVKRPPKKGSGWPWVLVFLAILLGAFTAVSALGNMEKPPAPALPAVTEEKPSAPPLPTDGPGPDADVSAAPKLSAYERAHELIPYFELRYFLSGLSEEELQVVCTIYESAMNFEDQCLFEGKVEVDRVKQLINLLHVECPELFQLDRNDSTLYYNKDSQKATSYNLGYFYGQSDYELMRSDCEAVISGFVRETSGLSDYEKEKYVFDYIASNCWYNADAAYAENPYGALVSFEAKCDGFSDAANSKYKVRDFYAGFAPIPVCDSMDASYYARTGHFVPAGTDPTSILSREVETLAANGGGIACVQFESAEEYEAFCDGANEQIVKSLLDSCGKHWNRYTWWELNCCVYMFRVEW